MKFKHESEYNIHLETHGSIDSKNEENGETFNNSPIINSLINSQVNNDKKVNLDTCGVCFKVFSDKLSLMEHAKQHDNIVYKCGICLLSFKDQSILIEHLKNHKKLDANVKESVNIQSNIISNEKSQSESPFVTEEISNEQNNIIFHTCNLCSISFLNESLYNDHMKIHDLTPTDLDTSITSLEINNIDNRKNFEIDTNGIVTNLEQMLEGIHSDQIELNTQETINKEVQPLETIQNLDSLLHSNDSQGFIKIQFLNQNNTLQSHIEDKENSENVSFVNEDSLDTTIETSPSVSDTNFIHLSNNELNDTNLKEIFDLVKEKKISVSLDEPMMNSLENFCHVEVKSELNHSSENVEISMYVCVACDYKVDHVDKLKLHFAEKHPEESTNFLCPYCNDVFEIKAHLEEHLLTHKQNSPAESQKPNNEKSLICLTCGLTFKTKKALKSHVETHSSQEFKCNKCNATFQKEKLLNEHQIKHHRDLHCKYCGKEIRQFKALRNHELRHEKVSEIFECETCNRVFKTKTGLRHHLAVHTGEYKFCCNYCGRGFMSRMMLEEHLSKHTKEERYICDVCGRKFTFQSTYWIHRKWHDNPYPYKCEFCNRMFRHSSLLAVHKRKHTGERPYKCPHCSLSFSVGGTLKRHLILHTGIYPFNCTDCKRGFTCKHKFSQHMAKLHNDFSHLNEKPPKTEFKMIVRDNVHCKPEEQLNNENKIMLNFDEDIEIESSNDIPFKVEEMEEVEKDLQSVENTMIPCTIITNTDMLVEDQESQVVEIVLDDTSQAVTCMNLDHNSLLPELWYNSED